MINLSTTGLLLSGGVIVESILLVLDALNQLDLVSKRMRQIAHGVLIGLAVALLIVTVLLGFSPQIGMILWLVFSLSYAFCSQSKTPLPGFFCFIRISAFSLSPV